MFIELFSHTDYYCVSFIPKISKKEKYNDRINNRKLTTQERCMVLAMSVLIDFEHFSPDKSDSGSTKKKKT